MDRRFHLYLIKVFKYTDENFAKGITIEDVATRIGYSPCWFNRLFKQYYGKSFGEYLRELRMKYAKEMLKTGRGILSVAKELSYTPQGFRKAFREHYGVSPADFVKTGITRESYVKEYEYRYSEDVWGKGQNPTPDGLWEFAYYNPKTNEYSLMDWYAPKRYFYAPFLKRDKSDPNWYCRNRTKGYGIHPGKEIQAVRSFLCPHDGRVEVLFSVGRTHKLKKSKTTPCSVRLFHEDQPIFPVSEAAVLKDNSALFCKATCTVKKGDRIRLHADSMGDIHGDALILYRQNIRYLELFNEVNESLEQSFEDEIK